MTQDAFEGIIEAICTQAETLPSTELQKIYAITDAHEARLAHDALVAFGVETKLYAGDGNEPSKLYVSRNHHTLDADAALAYAHTLKSMKDTMDNLNENLPEARYSIAFANTPGGGKQISITVTNPSKSPATASSTAAKPTPSRPRSAAHQHKRPAQRAKKKRDNGFSAGPSIGKRYPGFVGGKPEGEDSATKRFLLYITGNAFTSGFAFLMMVVSVAAMFSLFVMAKSFLCPDFATEKSKQNHAWYCKKD